MGQGTDRFMRLAGPARPVPPAPRVLWVPPAPRVPQVPAALLVPPAQPALRLPPAQPATWVPPAHPVQRVPLAPRVPWVSGWAGPGSSRDRPSPSRTEAAFATGCLTDGGSSRDRTIQCADRLARQRPAAPSAGVPTRDPKLPPRQPMLDRQRQPFIRYPPHRRHSRSPRSFTR